MISSEKYGSEIDFDMSVGRSVGRGLWCDGIKLAHEDQVLQQGAIDIILEQKISEIRDFGFLGIDFGGISFALILIS